MMVYRDEMSVYRDEMSFFRQYGIAGGWIPT